MSLGTDGDSTDRPSAARIYDYLLGGSNNFAADREVARQAVEAMPDLVVHAKVNRAFMNRAVRSIVDSGVNQFLDLGSGIPAVGNLHDIAERGSADARVVYVDIDPVAVAYGQRLLAGRPNLVTVDGDLRRPADILGDPRVRAVLDFDRPVAVVLVAVLHVIANADDPYRIVAEYRDALAPGSYLVIGHGARESRPEADSLVEISQQTTTPMTLRTPDEIARFFDGFDVVDPGLVWAPLWRPDGPAPEDPQRSGNIAGVGRRR
jgi:SAM-dependent methyltransferase